MKRQIAILAGIALLLVGTLWLAHHVDLIACLKHLHGG
ncbi:MAG: hypothetical protein JWM63_5018 [Gammaproteobacteria bacterium]|jgi:hypothetical protein|nr:hypothetical protein [Gammaproteobacteria bacterium]